nr:hypothetical protein [Capnocytophaga canimorsus]
MISRLCETTYPYCWAMSVAMVFRLGYPSCHWVLPSSFRERIACWMISQIRGKSLGRAFCNTIIS